MHAGSVLTLQTDWGGGGGESRLPSHYFGSPQTIAGRLV